MFFPKGKRMALTLVRGKMMTPAPVGGDCRQQQTVKWSQSCSCLVAGFEFSLLANSRVTGYLLAEQNLSSLGSWGFPTPLSPSDIVFQTHASKPQPGSAWIQINPLHGFLLSRKSHPVTGTLPTLLKPQPVFRGNLTLVH